MQQQLIKFNLACILKKVAYKLNSRLLIILLILFSSVNVWAGPGKGSINTKQRHRLLSIVTTDPSSLFFSAVESQPSNAKQVRIVVSGVSSGAQTTISAPDFYQILSATGTSIKTFVFTGNATVTLFVRFSGGDPGVITGQLTISGAEINTTTISLSTAVSPNPSFFPSVLNFSTINDGQPTLPLELDLTVSAVSPGAQTIVTAPDSYQLLVSPTGTPANALIFRGPGLFKFFVRFKGTANPGTFNEEIIVENTEVVSRLFPVKTVVLPIPAPSANPGSLTGFTAIEGGSASIVQSFDLSVKGLPTSGNPVISVTAPKGYSVGLSANASSFVNAFVVFASNGNISTKVFARLNSNNPVGPVNGNISITGSQIKPMTIPVTGTITAKPLPVLTVDKTSLTGFTTTTNKASVAQSYKLQAFNLDAGVTATVKAPAGYELSLSNAANSIFSSQLTVIQAAGVINATIFVRLKSQSAAGNIAGAVQNLVAGLTKNVDVSGTVVLPSSLNVNPAGITALNTVKNQASAAKTYIVTASNLAAGLSVTVTAPANFEVRLQGTGSFASTLTLTQNGTGSINRTLEVRLKAIAITGSISGIIQHAVAGLVKNVNVSGNVAAPALSTSATSLTFTAVQNQASAPKSYKVIASNLATGNTAVVTAPAGFEISLSSNGVFTGSLTLSQNLVNGINTDVFIRLKATAAAGTFAGNIQHASAGLTRLVSLSAVVVAPTLSVNPISINGFTAPLNQSSVAKTYSLVAANLANGVSASVTAPAGYEISVQGSAIFSTTLSLTQTTTGTISRLILVRLKAQTTAGTKTGNIINSVAGLSKTVALNGTVTIPLSFAGEIPATSRNSFDELSEENELFVKAFPNPVEDQLTIEFRAPGNRPVQIRLLNLQGKVLFKQELAMAKGLQQIKLSLAKQIGGSYFVEVVSGAKRKTVQIIKIE